MYYIASANGLVRGSFHRRKRSQPMAAMGQNVSGSRAYRGILEVNPAHTNPSNVSAISRLGLTGASAMTLCWLQANCSIAANDQQKLANRCACAKSARVILML